MTDRDDESFLVLICKASSYCVSRCRAFCARFVFGSFGAGCRILSGLKVRGSNRIAIGKGCFIGRSVELDASGGDILIGDSVEIRDGARILSKGIRIGDGSTVGEQALLNGKIEVAAGAWISRGCDVTGHVAIGRAILGPRTSVISGDHTRDVQTQAILMSGDSGNHKVVIEDGAWTGYGSIILKGVTLSQNMVVGAGSVVTKTYRAGEVIAGNPARPIRSKLSRKES